MLSMRHKSKSTAVDASQSLYTKEGLRHLFGISKARGKAYAVPPSYKAVVYDRGADAPTSRSKALDAATDTTSGHNPDVLSQLADFSSDEESDVSFVMRPEITDLSVIEPEPMAVEHDVIDLTLSP